MAKALGHAGWFHVCAPASVRYSAAAQVYRVLAERRSGSGQLVVTLEERCEDMQNALLQVGMDLGMSTEARKGFRGGLAMLCYCKHQRIGLDTGVLCL
jgi:hypothetical protein